jgi:hypothetical protein
MVITWNFFEKASILPAEGRRRESLEDLDEKFKLPILLAEWASKPMMVGYAISLIKCGDHQSTPEGLIDAALVMRHSIHMTSVRNPKSGSKYDYKMYAIVHRNAEPCSHILQQAGESNVSTYHSTRCSIIHSQSCLIVLFYPLS